MACSILNEDAFTERNLEKAGYASDPLQDGTLDGYQVYKVPMTSITVRATEGIGVGKKEAERAKNMFALGLVSWMFGRPTETDAQLAREEVRLAPEILDANVAAFNAGYNFGETTELFAESYKVKAAPAGARDLPQHRRRHGPRVGPDRGVGAQRPSPLLRELPDHAGLRAPPRALAPQELRRRHVQAEDEIAAANIALGAAFSGQLAVTGTSGPGIDLKAETIGLAVIIELPMIIVDVQRAGPSTGMPTKTEQADLLLAMYGRHGESPLPIVSASTPSECFTAALEAARIAVRYRTPVILLSDTFLANSSEPWPIPDVESLPTIDPHFASPNGQDFLPYSRDDKLARPWAIPGTPGLVHRIGGLERQDGTGNISYDAANHELMTRLRQAKVDGIADDIPALEVEDPSGEADLLVLGWGSTLGTISGCRRAGEGRWPERRDGASPTPEPVPREHRRRRARVPARADPGDQHGATRALIRAKYLVDAQSFSKVQGRPSSPTSSSTRSRGCSMSDVIQNGEAAPGTPRH